MKSKYKLRANKILIARYGCKDEEDLKKCFLANTESYIVILESMCQLAEEVKYSTNEKWINSMKDGIYTKEQVEELLQKQRELCLVNAKLNESYNGFTGKEITLDKNSILNAKYQL